MQKSLATLGFALLLSVGNLGTAAATDYYVSDCQTGAVEGCVAGADSNTGKNPAAPWKTTEKVRSMFSSLAAGDNILFARGGVWTNASMWGLRNLNSRNANPITFDAYQPSWYTGKKLPLLTDMRSEITMFAFAGNSYVHNEGYVVRNLELHGSPSFLNTSAFFTYRGASGLIVDNVTTKNFNIGFYCGDDSDHITLRNSTITHSYFTGALGGCDDWLVENNIFDHNGFNGGSADRAKFNHAIYIGADTGQPSENAVIRGNTFTNSVQFNGQCQGVVIVGHGLMKNAVVEDNVIDETPNVGNSKGGCWGIALSPAWAGISEKLENITIRRNRVINVGGAGIEIGGCSNCTIENNLIVKNDADPASFIGIAASGMVPLAEDAPMGALTIRNNSIYIAPTAPHEGSFGIQIWKGSNHVLVNNLIYFATSRSDNTCFTGDDSRPALPLSSFAAYDNNLCYRSANGGRYSRAYLNLAAAQAAGFDTHGSAANPQLAASPVPGNKWSMALLNGSPAIGAAHASRSAPADIDKAARSAPFDIGAFEYPGNSATVPGAPRLVKAKAVTGTTQATVTFSPPHKDGRRPVSGYTVTSSPAGAVDTHAGTTRLSHTMSGLVPGKTYTFTVKASNSVGAGAASVASNSVKIR